MDTPEIRNTAINSAEKYYNYLDLNDKGLQEVTVLEIMPVEAKPNTYKLRISARIFDIDSLYFRFLTTGVRYTPAEIKILEYDTDKHLLIVRPEPEFTTEFAQLQPRDIGVISDLKFLVERVKKWYEINGARLALPTSPSAIRGSLAQLQFLNGLTPSPQQREALHTVFHHPFSYIWGAPGTGKTQFVLSYALMHYLAQGKRVAILAPTNNAIEQVLRGVLQMTDKAGIPRSKLLRLGAPSRPFAEQYPEVCEERGLQRKIEEIDKQLARYTTLLTRVHQRQQWIDAHDNLGLFNQWEPLQTKITEQLPLVDQGREEYLSVKAELDTVGAAISQTDTRITQLQASISSLRHKAIKWFSKKPSREEDELETSQTRLIQLRTRYNYWHEELQRKEEVYQREQYRLTRTQKDLDDLARAIRQAFSPLELLSSLVLKLNARNRTLIENALRGQINEQLAAGEQDPDVDQSPAELEAQCVLLKSLRLKLASVSTEERLKGVNIVACTLDGYIGRFTDTRLLVDHVFLDEAGYANIIKALPLFSMQAPVTFLGDHMQLPPVCEITDQDMAQMPEYHNTCLWAQSAIFLEGVFTDPAERLLLEYQMHMPLKPRRMNLTSLTHTFRFDKQLAAILNKHVYHNGFTSSRDRADTKLYFVHAEKQEPTGGRVSRREVDAIRALISEFSKEEDYVILTPYRKQLTALGGALPKARNEQKILTVHGSQGREWDTVILSVVDTSDKFFVDSLLPLSKGLNLLNTAVSRTRRRLIIVCDTRYWRDQPGQLITDLLADAEEIKVRIFA